MDEYHQHDNSEHGFTRVHEFAERSDAHGADSKEPRPDGDQGHVGTFDAKAEELGKNADARGANGEELRQDRDQARVGTFDAKVEVAAGRYAYAGPRQVADFYSMRLRKNIEFGRRFAEVDGIADLIGLQHEYVRDMLLDYSSSFWSFYEMAGFDLRGLQQTAKRLYR